MEMAARYGATDAMFVKPVWQRWGYDYRLPDICPPEESHKDFCAMVEACKRQERRDIAPMRVQARFLRGCP